MTRASIEKDRITIVALLIVIAAGIGAFRSLPQAEDPGFIIRTATVVTQFPGASPERVENLVTDPIEEVVHEIPELDFVASESRTGVSIVFVNIQERYKAMRPIWDSLRRKIDAARRKLPEGVLGPVVNDEFGDVFGIVVTLTGDRGFTYAELEEIADEVRDELLRLPDAAKVEIHGAQEKRVFIEYNNARLSELNLSVGQLQQILQAQNIVMPGGNLRLGPERVVLEPSGNFEGIDDLRRTVIRLPGHSELIYLEDLAEVTRGYIEPPRSIVRGTGARGLALAISLREGGNILTLGEQVSREIRRLEALYPWGIEFERVADQPERVEKKVDEFVSSLLQAIAIVLIVMLVTLGLRTGFVVAALIPVAMLMTLVVMRFLGIGLDQMTLASLIIALGMLIDNAIVMSESILVKMREGRRAVAAAIESGAELRVPLLTSSLTTAAAFLPFRLAKSTSGEYTGVIFTVVTITLLCSWILALTMTPLLCVKFLRPRGASKAELYDSLIYRGYRRALVACLRHRWATALGTLALFAAAMAAFGQIPALFFPKGDRTFFTAALRLPTGSDIAATDQVVAEVEAFLEKELAAGENREEGVTTWASFVGGGEPRYILNANTEQINPAYAFMLVNTSGFDAVAPSIESVDRFCAEHFPDVVATVQPSDLGPPVEKPIQLRISGRDAELLFHVAASVKDRLRTVRGVRNVDDNWGRRTKKLRVEINQPRARRAGVTSNDIAISLQSLLSGVTTTEFREEDDVIPVVLRSVAADRQDLGKLDTLDVYSQTTGRSVPLKQVADIDVEWEPSKIMRRNSLKTITVESDLESGVTAAEVIETIEPWLAEQQRSWPRGTGYEIGGEVEGAGKANRSISEQLPVAGLIIVLLLVVQFNSFRKPLIVLATIPLGVIGVVIGLLLTGQYFGFMTLLGIVSLAGIVINNAIVLLDRIQIELDAGTAAQKAIVEASQRRLRPIILTTLTTIGGLTPLYLGGGPMWEPMAVSIMAGLAFATLLTLGFVPVLFSILYRVDFRGFRL